MPNVRPLVHVVDDDPSARQAIGATLQEYRIATEFWPSTTEFVHRSANVAPGCVVIDLCRPDLDGAAIQRHLNAPEIGLPCIVATESGCMDAAIGALRAGAIDFLRKPVDEQRMVAAVQVALGRMVKARRREATMRRVHAVMALLTPRERQVLEGLTRGYSNKEIARNLAISSRTVEIHRASVMEKLQAESLAQALRIAFIAEVCSMVNPTLHSD